jgi:sugar lactone lactonase YvrE
VATTSLLEPNTTGVDSVLLQSSGSPAAWTAVSNAGWLHLDNGSATGTGTAHVVFSFDANTGATRTGTLTLNPGSITVTVAQAGANYIPGGFITLDATQTSALSIAIDSSDNVYLNKGGAVKRSASTGQYTTLGAGVSSNGGIAVDQSGNVYYSDQVANIVFKWSSTSQTVSQVITSGLNGPIALAVDTAGNLYIADKGGIKMWNGSQLSTLTTYIAQSISVDSAGNLYLAQTGNNAILQWNSSSQQVTVLASGLSGPTDVVPDAAGNLYICGNGVIQLWSAATQQITTLVSQGNVFAGLAIDGSGNIFAIGYQDGLEELVRGFIGPANISEPAAAGSDSLLVAVPPTAPLGGPSSDQAWLTISGTTGGVVGFNFTANSGAAARVGHITAMGATITVTQAGTASNPGSIAATGGSGQGAAVSTAFASTLTAIVKDGNGNPLTGASVTFAGPASGAGVTFGPLATVITNNQGVATVSATANGTAGGPYTVTATVAGVSTPATFALTNFGAPASVTAVTGSGQRTLAGTTFAIPLEALVKDSGGNTLSGVAVTFAGTGATFSPSASVQTESAGVAIVTATANTTQGSYSVTASVGTLNATFSLTNDAASSLTASAGTPQSASLNGPFGTALQVTVKDSGGNPLNGATVNFSAPITGASAALSSASAITNANGVAIVTATANGTAGTYSVTASVSGVAGAATFALTNSSFSPCDPTQDGAFTVADIQRMVNETLGLSAPTNDLNSDGKVNAVDVQIVMNAVLNKGCLL